MTDLQALLPPTLAGLADLLTDHDFWTGPRSARSGPSGTWSRT